MALLYISEYSSVGTARSETPVGNEPCTDQAPLTVGAAVQSAAFATDTVLIRVHTDAICSIKIGTPSGVQPLATTSNKRMAANTTEYFGVKAGQKLSVIANT